MILANIGSLSTLDAIKTAIANLNKYGLAAEDLNELVRLNSSEYIVSENDIDLKVTGLTTLYTVPTGYKFYLSAILIDCVESTAITVPAMIDIDLNSTSGHYINDLTLTGIDAINKYLKQYINTVKNVAVATDQIKINVVTASTGTSQTAKVYLIGTLRSI